MTTEALKLFARQLARWAQQIIDNGRSPFRKVDAYPAILTERGVCRPPLVFWINRQSLMAGGLLLLPPSRAEEVLEEGARCARALGLRHFVTWALAEIAFWEDHEAGPRRCRSVPLSGPEELDIDRFRDELALVMEELKLLSVTGSIAPERLSAHYQANLCLGFVQDSLPSLTEVFRIARGQGQIPGGALTPEAWAGRRSALSLFRLLGLVFRDLLPESVQPQRLEHAMALHLPQLPPGLCPRPGQPPELPLPEEAAVRLHHLFRRLGQLNWRRNRERALQTVRLLLAQLGPVLDGHPRPEPAAKPEPSRVVLLNTLEADLPGDEIHLMGTEALLAGAALERDIRDLPPLAGTATTPLEMIGGAGSVQGLYGTLNAFEEPVDRQGRQKLQASLRCSWPTRRFALPRRTPLWVFELLHLLGLIAAGGKAHLRVPASWLSLEYAEAVFGLLEEQFTLHRVRADESGRHLIELSRQPAAGGDLQVAGPAGMRTLPEGADGRELRTRILLALQLPETVHALLERGRLQIPGREAWDELPVESVFLFAHSSLGRGLWQTITDGRSLPDRAEFTDTCRQCAFPLPAPEILAQLQHLAAQNLGRSEVDRELAFWLEADLPAEGFGEAQKARSRRTRAAANADDGRLAREIAAKVFVDGVPSFPEQYLFDYYRPQLTEFTFSAPLRVTSSFFGTLEMEDAAGKRLEVDGEELARTLVLASYGHPAAVALPADRGIAGEILARYRKDLARLRQALVREAHARLGNPKTADALVERIWRQHGLPPWEEVG